MEEYELREYRLSEVQDAFVTAQKHSWNVPSEITRWESSLPKEYSGKISNPLKALKKLYSDTEKFYKYILPVTPCKKGCHSCCRYDVGISELEARYIEKGTGIRRKIPFVNKYKKNSYEQCTFLKAGNCSIYEHRPFACRTHVTFTPTSFWCDPCRVETVKIPLMNQNSLMSCYALIINSTKRKEFGDIRDFFPVVITRIDN